MQLETDLRDAIRRFQREPFYQPIIDLSTMTISGFEALVRWNHPRRGLVSPAEFIPISEDTGLVVPMTRQILFDACCQIVEWQKWAPPDMPLVMNVNLSGKSFAHRDLVDQIKVVIEETGIDPSWLKLEITESAMMENTDDAIEMLWRI